MILVIRDRANLQQLEEMLQVWEVYVKLAVDIERGVIGGGGRLHYECEQILLTDGSKQKDIWGADWFPFTQEVGYESLINIRPSQNNRTMEVRDPIIRERIAQIVQNLLGGLGEL